MNAEINWRLDHIPRQKLEDMLWQAINEVQKLRSGEQQQANFQAMAAALILGVIMATAGFAFGAYLSKLT
jgi:hypothetical protein